jgi:hypothetical protein
MSRDVIPATVYNDTKHLSLVIVDGDNPGHFNIIGPKSYSTKFFRSIDAFGAYDASIQVPKKVTEWGDIWDGPTSSWWKTPDGCHVLVYWYDGTYYLRTVANLPFHGAKPSSASAWGF